MREGRAEQSTSLAAHRVLRRRIEVWVALAAVFGGAAIAANAILDRDSGATSAGIAPPAPVSVAEPRAAAAPMGEFGATPLEPNERFRVAGHVVERLAAGTYTYLRVHVDGALEDVWIVLSEDPVRVAAMDRVDVLVMARAKRFHSRRLDRDFPVLLFASTTDTAAPPAISQRGRR